MVDKKVVVKTIKKMLDSGIEDKVIMDTLADLGLNKEEAEEFLSSAKGETQIESKETKESEEPAETDSLTEEDYDIDSVIKKTSDKIKEHLSEKEQSDSLREQSTHLKLEEQDEKLDEIHKRIDSVDGKISSSPQLIELNKKVSVIEKDVSEIKSDLKDFKARIHAMHDIMKKILETDRKLLTKK